MQVSELVQQKLAQLLLHQLAACSLKAFYTHIKRKEVRSSAQFEIKHETKYTTVALVILKFVKKKKEKYVF